MSFSLREHGVRGVVLDIEGTTTPIAFVRDVLFPYARAHLREYLTAHTESDDVREAVRRLREERAADGASGDLVVYAERLMDNDRKSPGLKLLQGKIWERGYRDGTLRGQVFADVQPALARWRSAQLTLSVYSSGSVLAQRLLFRSTATGDLTTYFSHFFDTGVGAKQTPASYERIAAALHLAPREALFISDVTAELDAARGAGMQSILCLREGGEPQPAGATDVIRSFDEIAD